MDIKLGGQKNLWYHNANLNDIDISLIAAKSLRMLESINIFGTNSQYVEKNSIPSSMFIRFNLPDSLWRLHLIKLKKFTQIVR